MTVATNFKPKYTSTRLPFMPHFSSGATSLWNCYVTLRPNPSVAIVVGHLSIPHFCDQSSVSSLRAFGPDSEISQPHITAQSLLKLTGEYHCPPYSITNKPVAELFDEALEGPGNPRQPAATVQHSAMAQNQNSQEDHREDEHGADSRAQESPFDTFHPFQRLPYEIQFMIWELLVQSRRIQLERKKESGNVKTPSRLASLPIKPLTEAAARFEKEGVFTVTSSRPNPVALSVNKTSRELALQYYHPIKIGIKIDEADQISIRARRWLFRQQIQFYGPLLYISAALGDTVLRHSALVMTWPGRAPDIIIPFLPGVPASPPTYGFAPEVPGRACIPVARLESCKADSFPYPPSPEEHSTYARRYHRFRW